MIFPKKPKSTDLINAINLAAKDEVKILYRMLIEFNDNKYTSDLREFLLNHYEGVK